MARIVWTQREWKELASYFIRNGIDPRARGFCPAIKAAQQSCLPKERWRGTDGGTSVMFKPLVEAYDELKRLPPVNKLEVPVAKSLTDFSTEDLITEVIKRTVNTITEQIKTQVALQMNPLIAVSSRPPKHHNPFGIQPDVPDNRQRVLVIGPMEGQKRELLQAHSEWLNLGFVMSGENPARVAEVGWAAKHVVLWTNFISHAHQDQAKKLNARLHYVTGGMSALHDALKRIEQ